MITVNKQQIKELDACKDRFERFTTSTDNTEYDIDVIDLIGSDVTTEDLLWLAGEILSKKKIAQFAVDCAETVIHLSTDKGLAHNCIDVAKSAIKNDNKTNRDAASAVSAAAARAGAYAGAAAYAAYATYATRAYVSAIYAVYAARDAARAADNFDVKPHLIKLFTK